MHILHRYECTKCFKTVFGGYRKMNVATKQPLSRSDARATRVQLFFVTHKNNIIYPGPTGGFGSTFNDVMYILNVLFLFFFLFVCSKYHYRHTVAR